jgi:hypothetical protein
VLSIDKYLRKLSSFGMARKLRIQYEGAVYHVMNRGDHQEDIFRSDEERETERRSEEGQNSLASPQGNDDDFGMDRATVKHGHQDTSHTPALLAQKKEIAAHEVVNTAHRPLFLFYLSLLMPDLLSPAKN